MYCYYLHRHLRIIYYYSTYIHHILYCIYWANSNSTFTFFHVDGIHKKPSSLNNHYTKKITKNVALLYKVETFVPLFQFRCYSCYLFFNKMKINASTKNKCITFSMCVSTLYHARESKKIKKYFNKQKNIGVNNKNNNVYIFYMWKQKFFREQQKKYKKRYI